MRKGHSYRFRNDQMSRRTAQALLLSALPRPYATVSWGKTTLLVLTAEVYCEQ